MRKLRDTIYAMDTRWNAELKGWQPDDPSHPCNWTLVDCNPGQHITGM